MKKLILTMVFVFATGTTFMNANTSNKESPQSIIQEDYCLELHMEALEYLNSVSDNDELIVDTAESIYLECLEDFS